MIEKPAEALDRITEPVMAAKSGWNADRHPVSCTSIFGNVILCRLQRSWSVHTDTCIAPSTVNGQLSGQVFSFAAYMYKETVHLPNMRFYLR